MPEKDIIIGMGKYEVKKEGFSLTSMGIGSCIVAILIDEKNKVYGMAHIMLGYMKEGYKTANPDKYANVCIPKMIDEMIKLGAEKKNIIAKIAGGAHMFPTLKNNVIAINEKNLKAVTEILKEENIKIKSQDIGGNLGRTVKLDTTTGDVEILVRSIQEKKRL